MERVRLEQALPILRDIEKIEKLLDKLEKFGCDINIDGFVMKEIMPELTNKSIELSREFFKERLELLNYRLEEV